MHVGWKTMDPDSGQDNSKEREPCPEDTANCLSRISFWWLNWILWTGYKRPLEEDDLWALNSRSRSSNVVPRLRSIWDYQKMKCKRATVVPVQEEPVTQRETDPLLGNKEKDRKTHKKRKRSSLTTAIIKMFACNFLTAIVFKLIQDCLIFVQPQLLRWLIEYIEYKDHPSEKWRGYVYAASMFVAAILQSIFLHQYFHTMYTLGLRVRSAVIGMVYEKALVLNNASRVKSTAGEIVNLMSVDAQRVTDVLPYINILWSGPFQIGVALYFLHATMGWVIYAGLGVMLLFTPLNILMTRSINKYQVKQMEEKDGRIKIINEVLNGIKVLKLYAWEESFLEKINGKRSKELKNLLKSRLVGALLTLVFTTLPAMVGVTVFTVYVLTNHDLTAARAFVALSLFGIMSFPLRAYPNIIASCVQARVSIKRLEEFLDLEELDPDNVQRLSSDLTPPGMVCVRDGVFGWNRDDAPLLRNINLNIPSGSLVAVVGQVGSGKSTLLSALLGETEKLQGDVYVNGSVAYVSQQAWIQNATVRDNILFSSTLESDRYENVIDSCALKPDLEIFPAGDSTEIGERGINLSGGQKQRVSLARAVYNNADIYLLDDPLSAVDAHVGRKLFRDVIGPSGLLKDKTRILVTHNISFLPQMDHIVVLQNGFVSEEGTYSELLRNSGAFAEFLQTYSSEEDGETESNGELDGDEASLKNGLEDTPHNIEEKSSEKESSISNKRGDAGRTTTDETVEKGRVKFSLLLSYIKSTGIHWFIFTLFFYTTMEACTVFSGVWLAYWTAKNITTHAQKEYFLIGYGSIGGGQALFSLMYALTLLIGSIRASRRLHLKLIVNILRLPMTFFDVTPLGRVLNRLSKDIYSIDVKIPMSLRSFLMMFFDVIGMLVAVGYATPLFICVLPPLGAVYLFVQRVYVATSRQLRRIESANRSPIYSHFLETINGTTTIRAFTQQQRFTRENFFKVDEYQVAYYLEVSANRWLSLRIEFIGNFIIFFAALFAVISRDTISGGLAGLSVTYALQITNKLNWMIRMTSELETNLVAVERIAEYCDVPTEADRIIPNSRPVSSWPQQGVVQFHDFQMRYREGLPLVLKDLTFVINAAEKVGIVGRTGAGKSTLTLALFRILERAGGRIVIDGIDISQIGLHDLRSRLTIIPQEPVLYSGSLRMNLDPFEKHTDEELWSALGVSNLREFVSSLNGGLYYPVAEGGENLSVGQRQLVCLARALLRKSKILVLDEATAAVDMETDDLIQETIRREFADRTVLTIAHRLNTIMDYDRVMVLDNGSIVEFDSPNNLMARRSQFFSMVRDARINFMSVNPDRL